LTRFDREVFNLIYQFGYDCLVLAFKLRLMILVDDFNTESEVVDFNYVVSMAFSYNIDLVLFIMVYYLHS